MSERRLHVRRGLLNENGRSGRSVLAALFCSLLALLPRSATAETPRVPRLLELFTSEGCSSCPPAEELLARLAEEQPVPGVLLVPLSLHVTYWNDLGWSDPFSNESFDRRQEAYSPRLADKGVYTPQAILDGQEGLVPSVSRLVAASARLRSPPRVEVTLKLQGSSKSELSGSVALGALPAEALELWVAVTESDLVSEVKAGENRGRRLRHMAVTRVLKRLAGSPALAARTVFNLKLDPSWNRDHLSVVAFVQEAGPGAVRGVGSKSVSNAGAGTAARRP